jgi:hypothetical protein
MIKTYTSNELFEIAENIHNNPFRNEIYIPVKYNFYIQKNIEVILKEYDRIQKHRKNIIEHYGESQADGNFIIPKDKIADANKELEELSNLEHNIDITMLSIDNFENLELTTGELKSIMFMIEG